MIANNGWRAEVVCVRIKYIISYKIQNTEYRIWEGTISSLINHWWKMKDGEYRMMQMIS